MESSVMQATKTDQTVRMHRLILVFVRADMSEGTSLPERELTYVIR